VKDKSKNKSTNKKKGSKKKFFISTLGGTAVGFINGFFGGGGGMLGVPLLNKGLKESTKTSHATAILVILPITIVSSIFYGLHGYFNLQQTLAVGAGVFIGGIVGAKLLKKLPANIVATTFAIIMMVAGVKMVI